VAAVDPRRSCDALDAVLRSAHPPVIARIADARLLLDVRTMSDEDLARVAKAFTLAYDQGGT
jgi:seryl-tRNA(Sec) selenium transferase